jgi:hypothetical protein
MAVIQRAQNTSSPNLLLQATRKNASGVASSINLTGATVDALLYLNGGLINSGSTTCQVTDAVNGLFVYDLKSSDTANPGTVAIDILITYASGETEIQKRQLIMVVRAR